MINFKTFIVENKIDFIKDTERGVNGEKRLEFSHTKHIDGHKVNVWFQRRFNYDSSDDSHKHFSTGFTVNDTHFHSYDVDSKTAPKILMHVAKVMHAFHSTYKPDQLSFSAIQPGRADTMYHQFAKSYAKSTKGILSAVSGNYYNYYGERKGTAFSIHYNHSKPVNEAVEFEKNSDGEYVHDTMVGKHRVAVEISPNEDGHPHELAFHVNSMYMDHMVPKYGPKPDTETSAAILKHVAKTVHSYVKQYKPVGLTFFAIDRHKNEMYHKFAKSFAKATGGKYSQVARRDRLDHTIKYDLHKDIHEAVEFHKAATFDRDGYEDHMTSHEFDDKHVVNVHFTRNHTKPNDHYLSFYVNHQSDSVDLKRHGVVPDQNTTNKMLQFVNQSTHTYIKTHKPTKLTLVPNEHFKNEHYAKYARKLAQRYSGNFSSYNRNGFQHYSVEFPEHKPKDT